MVIVIMYDVVPTSESYQLNDGITKKIQTCTTQTHKILYTHYDALFKLSPFLDFHLQKELFFITSD
jgi:hypothetical protein